MPKNIPTENQVLGYMKSLSNWGRWGKEDQLGTFNLITPDRVAQAASLVREGVTVTCARPILFENAPDITSIPPLHYMIRAGTEASPTGAGGASDFIGLSFHGLTVTHLDSLSHQFWDGKMYNGFPANQVTAERGATVGSIDEAKHGVVTRGVLLDITKVRGVDWLEGGDGVFPDDLEAAEEAQGVHVESGDALLLRLGWFKRRTELGAVAPSFGRPGLHAAALPWLRERGVSLIAADASQDVAPSGYNRLPLPVHSVGIVAMGLWLIDAANFEELAPVCERLGRWDFMFMMAPLRLNNTTGSPVNPLAVF